MQHSRTLVLLVVLVPLASASVGDRRGGETYDCDSDDCGMYIPGDISYGWISTYYSQSMSAWWELDPDEGVSIFLSFDKLDLGSDDTLKITYGDTELTDADLDGEGSTLTVPAYDTTIRLEGSREYSPRSLLISFSIVYAGPLGVVIMSVLVLVCTVGGFFTVWAVKKNGACAMHMLSLNEVETAYGSVQQAGASRHGGYQSISEVDSGMWSVAKGSQNVHVDVFEESFMPTFPLLPGEKIVEEVEIDTYPLFPSPAKLVALTVFTFGLWVLNSTYSRKRRIAVTVTNKRAIFASYFPEVIDCCGSVHPTQCEVKSCLLSDLAVLLEEESSHKPPTWSLLLLSLVAFLFLVALALVLFRPPSVWWFFLSLGACLLMGGLWVYVVYNVHPLTRAVTAGFSGPIQAARTPEENAANLTDLSDLAGLVKDLLSGDGPTSFLLKMIPRIFRAASTAVQLSFPPHVPNTIELRCTEAHGSQLRRIAVAMLTQRGSSQLFTRRSGSQYPPNPFHVHDVAADHVDLLDKAKDNTVYLHKAHVALGDDERVCDVLPAPPATTVMDELLTALTCGLYRWLVLNNRLRHVMVLVATDRRLCRVQEYRKKGSSHFERSRLSWFAKGIADTSYSRVRPGMCIRDEIHVLGMVLFSPRRESVIRMAVRTKSLPEQRILSFYDTVHFSALLAAGPVLPSTPTGETPLPPPAHACISPHFIAPDGDEFPLLWYVQEPRSTCRESCWGVKYRPGMVLTTHRLIVSVVREDCRGEWFREVSSIPLAYIRGVSINAFENWRPQFCCACVEFGWMKVSVTKAVYHRGIYSVNFQRVGATAGSGASQVVQEVISQLAKVERLEKEDVEKGVVNV